MSTLLSVVWVLSPQPSHAAIVFHLGSSAPGHFDGIVDIDASFVRFGIYDTSMTTPVWSDPQPVVSGHAAFDLLSWGLPSARLAVSRCDSLEVSSCRTAFTYSAPYVPQDQAPDITWPSDMVFGPGENLVLDANETNPGSLRLTSALFAGVSLPSQGQTVVPLNTTHSAPVNVLRCYSASLCRTVETRTATVVKNGTTSFTITPKASPVVTPEISVPIPGPAFFGSIDVTMSLQREGYQTVTQEFEGVAWTPTGRTVPLDISGLADGTWSVQATSIIDLPGMSTPATWIYQNATLRIDGTAPVSGDAHLSTDTLYPQPDGYLDYIEVHDSAQDNDSGSPLSYNFKILDAEGSVVATYSRSGFGSGYYMPWNGRLANGVLVPEGEYAAWGTVSDGVLNSTTRQLGTFTVDHRTAVPGTETTTVLADNPKSSYFAERCSAVLRPAKGRGWARSVGLYGGWKCADSSYPSAGMTSSATVPMPTGDVISATVRVDTYGGAALKSPKSIARIVLYNAATGKFYKEGAILKRKVTLSRSASHPDSEAIDENGVVRWQVTVDGRQQFDVARFEVVVRYVRLEYV